MVKRKLSSAHPQGDLRREFSGKKSPKKRGRWGPSGKPSSYTTFLLRAHKVGRRRWGRTGKEPRRRAQGKKREARGKGGE